MASRDEMIRELKRRDMISQLKARDEAKAAAPAKDYNSPEVLAAEGDLTTKAAMKQDALDNNNILGVTARGLVRGATLGASDYIGAAGSTIGDAIVNPKDTFNNLGDRFSKNLDRERITQDVDRQEQPVLSTATEIAGAVGTGKWQPTSIVGQGLVGGATGALNSRAEDAENFAGDVGMGMLFGSGGAMVAKAAPAAGKAIRNPIKSAKEAASAIGDAVDSVKNKTDLVTGSFKEGYRSAPDGVGATARSVGGAYNVAKTLLQTSKDKTELSELANAIRKTYGPGAATDLSDEAVLMSKLLEPGDNLAKRHVASKYAAVHGGDAEQYIKLLNNSADDTTVARSFNKIEAGEELAGDLSNAYKETKGVAGKAYEDATGRARDAFQPQTAKPLQDIDDLAASIADDETISGQAKAYFREARKRLGDDFEQLEPQEQFDRLLETRRKIKEGVKWASRTSDPGQVKLEEAYHTIGGYLKSIDDQATADAGYSAFKGLEDSLFKKVGDVKRNRIQGFDPIKVEGLFSGSSNGRRLAKQVQAAQELLESGKINPEQAQQLKATLDKIQGMQKSAGLQRDLNNFRYKDAGPSSPAIQRMTAIAGKDSAVTTAVRAPQLFLKMREEAAKLSKSQFGKSIDQLKPSDREKVAKYALWISQNEGATDTEVKRKLMDLGLMDVKKGGTPGSGFSGGTTLNDLGDFAAQRAVKYGADQAYNAVTGEEEGAPDPVKEQATEYLKQKFNLTDEQAKLVKRMMPGLYDMAGMVKGKVNRVYKDSTNNPDYKRWLKQQKFQNDPRYLYHETTSDALSKIREGNSILPVTGEQSIRNADGRKLHDMAFFSDDSDNVGGWTMRKIANKLNKPFEEITDEDIKNHGGIAFWDLKDGDSTTVFKNESNQRTGEELYRKLGEKYQMDLNELADEIDAKPSRVITDPNDLFTVDSVEPTATIDGNELLDFLQSNPEVWQWIQSMRTKK